VRRKGSRDHYLSSGRFWYESSDPMGPWTSTNSPPNDLVRMLPEPDEAESGPATPPAIVTADVPTELISTQGEPDWQPLQGGDILYVANTESPWLRDLSTNNMYVLLSGRWYRSKSADGPWTFVPSDELPASFANIPPASDIGGLRTSVAGTPEAEDAVLDAQIPQTAAI
ncbi:MAG: carbohydrate-binding family V/XII, partial [Woeseiaceae bacterium]